MNETLNRLTAALSDRYRVDCEVGEGGTAVNHDA
jgi:hypothetical protein